MKYSELFGKTLKKSRDYESANATLLIKAGFIQQNMAGVYTYLPLGLRVLQKIEQITREEMNKIGQEVFLPAIVPTDLWEATGRIDTVDVLFKVVPGNDPSKKRNDAEYILNSTQEEVITPVAKKVNYSYRDFPFALYQIQTKFRNEPRPKSGILRGREFRMKDLYSFHTSEESLKEYYEKSKDVYTAVFDRVGLGEHTVIAAASGGDFTDDYSHEFQTRCEAGEDLIFQVPSTGEAFNLEVAPSKAPDVSYEDKEMLEMQDVEGKGIIGVEELSEYLKIPVEKTTKTLLFETDDNRIIAAAVRGGYDINEEKLKKVVEAKHLQLASADTVRRITGAEVGFAGVLDLPDEVEVYFDDSTDNRMNFEMGANKTDFHSININWGRDIEKPEKFYDFKMAKEGDMHPESGEVYDVFKASEVGNIFPLYTKFSEAFGYTFTDEEGNEKPVIMGSYGLGTTRLMGVIVERFHDEKGIIWPASVSPFDVHLVSIGDVDERAQEVKSMLEEHGIEVLWDDRDVSAGEKFADADLIGIPVRLVVSGKTGEQVEWKRRDSEESELISFGELLARLK